MQYGDLAGKTFIVTGAASGIRPSNSKESEGGSALSVACDVGSARAMNDAVKAVVDRFGSLHGAANMAGIARTKKIAPVQFALKTLDDDDWDTILRVNLDGVKNSLRAEIQSQYLPEPTPDYLTSPLLATSHAALPPALIQAAGMDPLRDEDLAYAESLKAAG
ncbi:hypothetical protein CLAIMM_14553 [Cladophialophora immunda]|nr:hypothetical protein CLAIMM_14553 [Cladophialophora immunda]